MYQAIGMGAQALGSIMQAVAANQAQKEMAKQFEAEIARQQRFQSEGYGIWQPGTVNMGRETAERQMAQGKGEREASYQQMQRIPGISGQGTTKLQDRLKLNLLGNLRASLGQYGDWQHQQGLDLSGLQTSLGRVFDKSAGQARIFPYRMEEAQHSWDQLAAIGQLISSLGGGATNFASLGQKQQPQRPASNAGQANNQWVPQWGSGQSMYTMGL